VTGSRRLLRAGAALAGGLAVLLAAGCASSPSRTAAETPAASRVASSATRAVVWAVGDGADGSASARQLARRMAAHPLDRLLYLGDVYERGTPAEFRRDYASVYGRLARETAPTPGNHDWPLHSRGYDRYWGRVLGRRLGAYYSFRLAGWQVLSLNSEAPHGRRSAQLRWLRRELRGPGSCRLAFWHRPRYSAGLVHGDQPDVAPLWNALRGRARLVLSGHEHDMQRLRRRDGLTELVSGAGGHGHYPIDRGYRGLAFANDADYGALRLVLRPGRASFAFLAADGRTLDSGRASCRR
jgi:3',5'-cyclic AMP phosphodiesterase CpdA